MEIRAIAIMPDVNDCVLHWNVYVQGDLVAKFSRRIDAENYKMWLEVE